MLLTPKILNRDPLFFLISFASAFDMGLETKLWFWVALLLTVTYMQHCVDGQTQVPCLFSFGDSLSDNGNNNNLQTEAKSNYPPYGIDFPLGPTGRFTNGRTILDIIGQLLGFENFIPPFANTSASDILKGVNYASGAAGIRVETGIAQGANINLGLQIANHGVIVLRITARLGSVQQARKYLNTCLYYSNIGSNDYLNNYFMPQFYPSSRIFTPERYADALIQQYNQYLEELHELGARKFALVGLGSLGCTPAVISNFGTNGSTCVDRVNKVAQLFNDRLKSLVDSLNIQFTDSKFIFVNTAAIQSGNPLAVGFTVFNTSCCLTGTTGQCVPNETPCPNRSSHIFFDKFHTTDRFNEITAIRSYNASNPMYTDPIDIQQLAQS